MTAPVRSRAPISTLARRRLPGTLARTAAGIELDTLLALTQRISGGIVTSMRDGRPNGSYVGFITAASLRPPRLLVGTSEGTLTTEFIEASGVLAIHPWNPGPAPALGSGSTDGGTRVA